MRILLNQLSVSENKEENLKKIISITDKYDADLMVFPEYLMGVPKTNLTYEYVSSLAEPLTGKFISRIVEKTAEKDIGIIFTAYLLKNKKIYNTAIFAEKGIIRGIYKKIHLFDAFGYKESKIFSRGNNIVFINYKGFKISLSVCFDIRFPEIFRYMMYNDTDIVIIPSAWYRGKYKVIQWFSLALSRAHENNMYVILVNQTGEKFIGHSLIASPLGYISIDLGEEEKSLVYELDIEEILSSRKILPIKKLSQRPLYSSFYSRDNIQG